MKFRLILIISIIATSLLATAEKMDQSTHSFVINKLERVLEQTTKKDSSRPALQLRLADLYSERARLRSIAEIEKDCNNCLHSIDDRKTALSYYQKSFNRLDSGRKEIVLLQMAHLQQILNRPEKAKQLFRKIIKKGKKAFSPRLVAQAYVGIADSYFYEGKFLRALKNYQSAVSNSPRKGYVTRRIAWSYFNLGKETKAISTITKLLRSPQMLEELNSKGKDISISFFEDASRDLATFLARSPVGPRQLQNLLSVSPKVAIKENLRYLANELDRVGQKKSALFVWKEFYKHQDSHFDRLEVQVRVAQIHFDLGQKSAAAREFEAANVLWRDKGCKDTDGCALLQSRLRAFVTDWNKVERKKPSRQLLSSYKSYISTFPEDAQMLIWSAETARKKAQYKSAIDLYRKASLTANKQLGRSPDKHQRAQLQNILEAALLGEIEVAEISKNSTYRENAYSHYLNLNPKGLKSLEVRYQQAQNLYQSKKYSQSAKLFTSIAFTKNKSAKTLRKKSADLALDAIALSKSDKLLEERALEFSKLFPKARVEFVSIARKALLKQTDALIDSKKSGKSDWKRFLKRLTKASLAGADDNEKIAFFKNKVILGEKLADIDAVKIDSVKLLRVKTLSSADKEWTRERLLWAAEMRLEFLSAFNIAKSMKLSKLSEEKRLIKLGLLAELALRNPTPYYKKFIKKTNSRQRANEVRARLITRSTKPWKALMNELDALKRTPVLLSDLALTTFARFRNFSKAEKILKVRGVKPTPAGKTLRRLVFFKDFRLFDKKIRRHRLRTNSDYLLQKTLKKRLELITDAEKWSAQAVSSRDWSSQLLALTTLQRENQRLHSQLIKLKAPSGLTKHQRTQYTALLKRRAQPFLTQATRLDKKLQEFWNNKAALEGLTNEYRKAPSTIAHLVAEEIGKIKAIAPKDKKRHLKKALAFKHQRPSRKQILNARAKVVKKPFDLNKAIHLKKIEQQAGGETMVAYLDGRLKQLKGAKR